MPIRSTSEDPENRALRSELRRIETRLASTETGVSDAYTKAEVDDLVAARALLEHRHPWADLDDVPVYASRWPTYGEIADAPAPPDLSGYLPLTGGVLTGDLTVDAANLRVGTDLPWVNPEFVRGWFHNEDTGQGSAEVLISWDSAGGYGFGQLAFSRRNEAHPDGWDHMCSIGLEAYGGAGDRNFYVYNQDAATTPLSLNIATGRLSLFGGSAAGIDFGAQRFYPDTSTRMRLSGGLKVDGPLEASVPPLQFASDGTALGVGAPPQSGFVLFSRGRLGVAGPAVGTGPRLSIFETTAGGYTERGRASVALNANEGIAGTQPGDLYIINPSGAAIVVDPVFLRSSGVGINVVSNTEALNAQAEQASHAAARFAPVQGATPTTPIIYVQNHLGQIIWRTREPIGGNNHGHTEFLRGGVMVGDTAEAFADAPATNYVGCKRGTAPTVFPSDGFTLYAGSTHAPRFRVGPAATGYELNLTRQAAIPNPDPADLASVAAATTAALAALRTLGFIAT
jgi:hypothetical protein